MLNAAYFIPALPLAGFVLLCLGGRTLGDPRAGVLATAMMAGAFVASVVTFFGLRREPGQGEGARHVTKEIFTWISVGRLDVKVALLVDPLSITMALFVTGVGTLIHLYAIGYMRGDSRYPRFFVYLNLFGFSMLMLVLGDSFLLMFLGWEGVGLCSYLLVSFWFERNAAAVAGKKAFVTNRVGDVGFMLAMFLLFSKVGSLTYSTVFEAAAGGKALSRDVALGVGLLFFLGAAGKSAQLPLYVWLPDAMEGPTPVSALIHAATMVTAGVYLLARISPILALNTDALVVVAWVGGLTALFAATIACAQNDIKKVLAYSTISQLGYMFLAVGSGAYVAGLFHMITHAFFKALLFLGAGSVIHGLHEQQDMKRMGALRKWMPITSATFIVGWLSIAGVPPFAGFWSKDDILLAAYHENVVLWAIGLFTALLTAYYMTRQVQLVFFGDERFREEAHPAQPHDTDAGPETDQLTEPEPVTADHPAGAGDHGAHGAHGDPHESPWTMAVPLVVLAALALVGGVLNLPFSHRWELLDNWLEPSITPAGVANTDLRLVLAVLAIAASLAGIALGLRLWARAVDQPRLEPSVLQRAWYVDIGLARLVSGPGEALANFLAYTVDKGIIDGAVNGVGTLVRSGGGQLRKLQTGYVRNYALGVAAGAVVLLAYVVVRVGT